MKDYSYVRNLLEIIFEYLVVNSVIFNFVIKLIKNKDTAAMKLEVKLLLKHSVTLL